MIKRMKTRITLYNDLGKAIVASHGDGKERNLSVVPLIDGKVVGFLLNYKY